mmetsp:Transcript_37445/g.73667  ORF Transcript_37445/g.73667 Transcript_37445/m.73667 type:complete len:302 (+) Transcript_37445:992-1897(+)
MLCVQLGRFEPLHRHHLARPSYFKAFARLVGDSTYTRSLCSTHCPAPVLERARGHDHVQRASTLAHRGLHHYSFSWAGGGARQIQQLCTQVYCLSQLFHVEPRLGRHSHSQHLSAVLFRGDAVCQELLVNLVGVGTFQVALVDGYHDRAALFGRQLDGFHRLWLHSPVCRYHQHCHIRQPAPSGSHVVESGVARGVQEHSVGAPAGERRHSEGADRLRDPTCLPSSDVGLAHVVKHRGLPVVYVSHHAYNRSSPNQVGRIFVCLLRCLLLRVEVGFSRADWHLVELQAQQLLRLLVQQDAP